MFLNKNLGAKYKIEIEQTIKAQIPLSKNKIEKVIVEVKGEQNPYLKTSIIEQGFNAILFEFYMKLIAITDKYTHLSSNIPETDWHGELQKIINPYLKYSKVNVSDLEFFLEYMYKKQAELENEYKN